MSENFDKALNKHTNLIGARKKGKKNCQLIIKVYDGGKTEIYKDGVLLKNIIEASFNYKISELPTLTVTERVGRRKIGVEAFSEVIEAQEGRIK